MPISCTGTKGVAMRATAAFVDGAVRGTYVVCAAVVIAVIVALHACAPVPAIDAEGVVAAKATAQNLAQGTVTPGGGDGGADMDGSPSHGAPLHVSGDGRNEEGDADDGDEAAGASEGREETGDADEPEEPVHEPAELHVTFAFADDEDAPGMGTLCLREVMCSVEVEGAWDQTCLPTLALVSDADGSVGEVDVAWEIGDTLAAAQLVLPAGSVDDGAYCLSVAGTDGAGDVADVTSPAFVVDVTAPKVAVSWENTGGERDDATYFRAGRVATVVVTDDNFSAGAMRLAAQGGVLGPWREGDDGSHVCSVTFSVDGSCSLSVRGADAAGNEIAEVEGALDAFVVDTMPPQVSIAFADAANLRAGVAYFDAPTAVTVQVRDNHLDVERTTVNGEPVSWSQVGKTAPATYEATLTYGAGAQSVPAVSARDLAGNVGSAQITTDGVASFVIDMCAPAIEQVDVAAPTATYGGTGAGDDAWWFYSQPTTMTFAFADDSPIARAALYDPEGLYHAQAAIAEGARTGTLVATLVDGATLRSAAAFGRDILLTVTDVAGNERVWSIGRTGEVREAAGAGEVPNASLGGWNSFPRALVVDATAPVVAIEQVEAGAMYAHTVHARVSVVERAFALMQRFCAGQAVVNVTRREPAAGGATVTSTVPVAAFACVDEGSALYAYEHPFFEDGHYSVMVQVSDLAGNVSNVATIAEFTVDTTAPIIAVAWDGGSAHNGSYYRGQRTATISVAEHNFAAWHMEVDTTGTVGAWTHDGDMHTCTVTFASDGTHLLSVGGIDAAGNTAVPFAAEPFVIDTVRPTVEIVGVVDGGAYGGDVTPRVTLADDANLDASSISCSLKGANNATAEASFDREVTTGEGAVIVSFADFAHVVTVDDVYTLTAGIADLAGNVATRSVTFSVNRFGSNFVVESVGDEGAYEAGFVLATPPEVVIREVNVSGASATDGARTVTVTRPGASTQAVPRVDGAAAGEGFAGYTLQEGQGTGGWHEYVYRIGSGNFGDELGEGRYLVDVASVDAARNRSTTAAYVDHTTGDIAAAEVEFTLDTVGPAVALGRPGLVWGDDYVGSFRVIDDVQSSVSPDVVEVCVDGKPLDMAAIEGPDVVGAYHYRVASMPFANRHVSVTVTDHAGRTATDASDGLVMVPPAYVARLAAAGVAAVVVVIGAFHHARRSRMGAPLSCVRDPAPAGSR